MLMIIAPSKTQDFSGSVKRDKTTQPLFLEDSALLIEELQKFSVSGLGKLMKMSERLALQTQQRITDFDTPFTAENGRPALRVFQGDVYSRINTNTYEAADMEYAQNHLRILSGLYGILRPMDLMQSYRLEMGCRLPNSRGKNLYEFWGEKITDGLNQTLAEQKEPILVNLASSEYSRAISKKNLRGAVLQIDFKERKGDIYRTVAIHAKRARGMMVDFTVKNRLENVSELKAFQADGYTFRPELSQKDHYCFTRE